MSENLLYTPPEQEREFLQYVPDLEPLVEKTAPEVGDNRAFLGRLCDLLPSGTPTARQLTAADQDWLVALEHVAHAHQLSYELIADTGESDSIWLVPPH